MQQKEMNIQLSDEDKQKIVSLMEKISSLDLDVDSLKEQAKVCTTSWRAWI